VPHPRCGRVGPGVAALNFQLCPLETRKGRLRVNQFTMLQLRQLRDALPGIIRNTGAAPTALRSFGSFNPALARWATFFRTYGACASEGNGLDRDTRRARLRKRPFICTHRVLAASPPAQVGLSSRAQLCCAHGKLSRRDRFMVPNQLASRSDPP
jgi:hypothetical protein